MVKYEHVPFSAPEAIADVRLLRLSVAMNDPGCGISVANKEQRLVSMMTYVVCAGIDGQILLIIGRIIILIIEKNM